MRIARSANRNRVPQRNYMPHDIYENPLISRYASREMAALWGDQRKFSTWRQLWVWLAEAEAELGLPSRRSRSRSCKAAVDTIDFDAANRYERKLRHDVMAHVHAYGDQCPAARPIIHLGATSCYVTDNTDLILMREGLRMIAGRLAGVIVALADFAKQHRDLASLGFTHLQPAQPTTVGKRACLWAYDLALDLAEVEHRIASLKARSVKGTTGTQASFLKLFDGDHAQGPPARTAASPRRWASRKRTPSPARPTRARSMRRCSTRSPASPPAPTKRPPTCGCWPIARKSKSRSRPTRSALRRWPTNATRCGRERICGLARFAMSLPANAAETHATQWLERTLDDSANRRLVLPQAFLAIDAVLMLYQNVATGLVVYPQVIARHLREELPFMATENILMAAVAAGGDRQELHERIRQHSQAAAAVVKQQGGENDLLERLQGDKAFAKVDLASRRRPGHAHRPQRRAGRRISRRSRRPHSPALRCERKSGRSARLAVTVSLASAGRKNCLSLLSQPCKLLYRQWLASLAVRIAAVGFEVAIGGNLTGVFLFQERPFPWVTAFAALQYLTRMAQAFSLRSVAAWLAIKSSRISFSFRIGQEARP